MLGDAAPQEFDVTLDIQSGLGELDLYCPVTQAIKIADADALSFEIRQRLDLRRPDPGEGFLVSPPRDDVDIGAPRSLKKNGAGLNVQRDINGLFLHRL